MIRPRQPPPRGCVLKLCTFEFFLQFSVQPPPRGCVLKPLIVSPTLKDFKQPPPRGCVLKPSASGVKRKIEAAASARLCVETADGSTLLIERGSSRLRAAVC